MPFVLATAAYDDAGKVVGSIGATSAEVVTTLPLPRLLLWAYLARGAAQLGCVAAAAAAASQVERALEARVDAQPLWAHDPTRRRAFSARHCATRRVLSARRRRRCCSPHSCAPPHAVGDEASADGGRAAVGLPQAEQVETLWTRSCSRWLYRSACRWRRCARWAGGAGATQRVSRCCASASARFPAAAARLRRLRAPPPPATQLAASRRTPRLLVRLTYELVRLIDYDALPLANHYAKADVAAFAAELAAAAADVRGGTDAQLDAEAPPTR